MSSDPRAWETTGRPNAWGWVLASALVLIAAGALSVAAPAFTTVAISVILGWVLVIAGIAGIVMGIRAHSAHRRWSDLLYGIVSLGVGIWILYFPVAGAASLTLAFAVWLLFRGIIEIGGAFRSRSGRMRGGLLLAGIVNLIFAILLFVWFPWSIWVVGLFVGISFLLGGLLSLVAAFELRHAAPPAGGVR